ncbi:ABC transporter substrate-binding protein [Subsaxibacter sp. CAU 1640]|uniref:ABC transporter substrate-binding protein n=1 Tax=Subsaxibacter sp. CAU 1640 TaxID=2933271 RepID=UPI0020046183|nr:ABC transporter substrate-binding protein [Subsaxibacter sp. CAU 1640]MCK7589933.1 ABC transporter substrate-binding protein [Subsaxibacter sp. CAU 1640]
MKKFTFIFLFLAAFSCKEDKEVKLPSFESEENAISYAKGFSIINFQDYSVLEIKNPWPKSEKTYRYALVKQEKLSVITLNSDEFDGILSVPIEKIVVTSTTHIPALELLGETKSLIGFPGTDYISSEDVRKRIDNNLVRELGKNEGINTEVLLELRPDVVVGFGIDGNNKTFETIKKSGIPVIYNGDWVETSPLAKAEWVKFFGALYDKEKEADSIFNQIEKDYVEAKKIASDVQKKPTVLSGALHKDVWYLPSGSSPEAQLLKDANVDYLWQDVKSEGSLALSFEAVFEKAKNAEIWISPSYYNSLEALEKANEHYTRFDAFKNKNIYSFVNTKGATGGVTYYELGTARPDLVLKDLVKICHPELLTDYEPHFFKNLE